MTIPKSFTLHGQTIRVVLKPEILQQNDNLGEASYRTNSIHLVPTQATTWTVKRDRLEQIYIHEMVHFILHEMGDPHYKNEQFVELFSSLLHQALTTQKGVLL